MIRKLSKASKNIKRPQIFYVKKVWNSRSTCRWLFKWYSVSPFKPITLNTDFGVASEEDQKRREEPIQPSDILDSVIYVNIERLDDSKPMKVSSLNNPYTEEIWTPTWNFFSIKLFDLHKLVKHFPPQCISYVQDRSNWVEKARNVIEASPTLFHQALCLPPFQKEKASTSTVGWLLSGQNFLNLKEKKITREDE